MSVGIEVSSDPTRVSSFVASGTVKKVIEINPYLLGTMAGGAGQLFIPKIRVFDLENGSRLPVLGNLSWHPLPTPRTAKQGKNLRLRREQIS